MKIDKKIQYLTGIVFVGAALALCGCNNGPVVLPFEIVGKQTGYINNVAAPSSIEVLDSRPLENLPALSPEDQSAVQSIDYSGYFVLVVTFGHGYYYQDSVIKISQFKDVFWVQTNLDTSSSNPEGSPNYQIVKIPKAGMIRYGKLTFRLMDSQFAEIAKAIQTVSAPPGENVSQTRLES